MHQSRFEPYLIAEGKRTLIERLRLERIAEPEKCEAELPASRLAGCQRAGIVSCVDPTGGCFPVGSGGGGQARQSGEGLGIRGL